MKAAEFDKIYAGKTGKTEDEARKDRLAFIETIKHGLFTDGVVDFIGEFSMETYKTKETRRSVATKAIEKGGSPERKTIVVPPKTKVKLKIKKGFLDFLELAKIKGGN